VHLFKSYATLVNVSHFYNGNNNIYLIFFIFVSVFRIKLIFAKILEKYQVFNKCYSQHLINIIQHSKNLIEVKALYIYNYYAFEQRNCKTVLHYQSSTAHFVVISPSSKWPVYLFHPSHIFLPKSLCSYHLSLFTGITQITFLKVSKKFVISKSSKSSFPSILLHEYLLNKGKHNSSD
jgi:hypothetical protein